jgi:type VI secretion system protein ImpE
MDATQLYQEGRLEDAIAAVTEQVRDNPTDGAARTFLFELLCFAGELDRALKQLHAIGSTDPEAHLSTAWYQEAVLAEQQRHEMFRKGELPDSGSSPASVSGTLNGRRFETLVDADPRIGARLEVLVGGRYTWIPFEHLAQVTMESPKKLRDLFWAPAQIEGTEDLGSHTGEVLLPAMTPLAAEHPNELVRLGRVTEWGELETGEEYPIGQKLLLVDDEEFSLLELRDLEFDHEAD